MKKVNRRVMLEPGGTYHVYNRAVGKERPFPHASHYEFFMMRYKYFIAPMVETLCYCLMPNHYHFLIRVKDPQVIELFRAEVINRRAARLGVTSAMSTLPKLTSFINRQFMSFFSSYTQAFNKQQSRKGNLFMKDYCRVQISDETQLVNTVIYIHRNPVEAGLCTDPAAWELSSLNDILSGQNSIVDTKEVIELFGDLPNFRYCHYPEL